jgi:hypothetical protein
MRCISHRSYDMILKTYIVHEPDQANEKQSDAVVPQDEEIWDSDKFHALPIGILVSLAIRSFTEKRTS